MKKSTFQIVSTKTFVHFPEKSKLIPHETDLFSLSELSPDEIKQFGLFLVGEKIEVKEDNQ